MNSAFKPVGATNGGQVSLPAFGTSNNLFGGANNTLPNNNNTNNLVKPTLFGNQTPQTNTFGAVGSLFNSTTPIGITQPANGALLGQQPAANSLFGQSNQPAASSLFGQNTALNTPALSTNASFGLQPQGQGQGSLFNQGGQAGNSLFGNAQTNTLGATTNQPSSLFANTSTALAGGIFAQNSTSWNNPQPQTNPQTSLFGQTQTPPQGSLFGQNQTQTSLFGQSQTQPQTSLFGQNQPPAQTSLFGVSAQPQGTLFGQNQGQGNLFNASMGVGQSPLGVQPTNSLFGTQTHNDNAGSSLFSNQPALGLNQISNNLQSPAQPNLFAQLTNSLIPPVAPMDQNLQTLIPQLLLAMALGNNQSNSSTNL